MGLSFLSYKLWKLRTELQKQTNQIASKYSKKKKKTARRRIGRLKQITWLWDVFNLKNKDFMSLDMVLLDEQVSLTLLLCYRTIVTEHDYTLIYICNDQGCIYSSI